MMKVELTEAELNHFAIVRHADMEDWAKSMSALIQRKVDQALAQAAPNPVTEDEAREIYETCNPSEKWERVVDKKEVVREYNLARGIKPEEPTPTTDPYDAVLTVLDKRGAELPEVRKRLEELLTAEQRVKALGRALGAVKESVRHV